MKQISNLNGNPSQLRAIEHGVGAACVIAGPGSGKTFVIIRRIIRLIEKGVNPGEILVITFTKAAAIEMQQRFIKETNSMYPEVLFGTFHSCFYNIIKSGITNYDTPVSIMTENDKYRLLTHVIKVLQSKIKEKRKENQNTEASYINYDQDTLRGIISEISKIKNDGESPENADNSVPLKEYFSEIYREYTNLLRDRNLIDFEDMVLMCYQLLKKRPDLLKKYQSIFKYILIDEYQDINRMQFEVIRLLSGENGNLFVVGDDDQSIYGFRGSKPELMMDFCEIFKNSEKILLDRNYRCGSDILNVSLKVINENKHRFKKDIKSGIPDKRGVVTGAVFVDKAAQYNYVLEEIKKKNLTECAVIFRTNLEATSFARFLISNNIPCSYRERIEFFHEKKVIKSVLSYLRFVSGNRSRRDFFVLMNQPVRYIARDSVRNEPVTEEGIIKYYSDRKKIYMLGVVQKLFRDLKMIEKLRPYLAIHYVRKVVGFDKYLREEFSSDRKKLEEELNDLDKFMDSCKRFKNHKELWDYLENQEKIKNDIKTNSNSVKNGVKLMTMHASKGLEFPCVFLPDLNEGIIPSRKSITPEEIEEERRMLYVAMTRAKDELHLSYIRGTKENPMRMSGFLRPVMKIFDDKNRETS